MGGALRRLSRTQSREYRGRSSPKVLEQQTASVQSGKASSGSGGRADAASCGGDRGRALRKVLVSSGNPTRRRGRVTWPALPEDSHCARSRRLCLKKMLKPEGVSHSAPAGTAAGSALPFRPSDDCGAAGTRSSLSTQDHAGAGPHGRGREPGASPTQVPWVARPRPRGWQELGHVPTRERPRAAETRTLTASNHLPAPAAAKCSPRCYAPHPAPRHEHQDAGQHPPPGDRGPRYPSWGCPRTTRRPGPPHRKLISTKARPALRAALQLPWAHHMTPVWGQLNLVCREEGPVKWTDLIYTALTILRNCIVPYLLLHSKQNHPPNVLPIRDSAG